MLQNHGAHNLQQRMNHLQTNNILSDVQYGNRNKRSCESQLLLTTNDFVIGLNEGQQIDSILLDFSKAFDKVNHHKLCAQLHHGMVLEDIV